MFGSLIGGAALGIACLLVAQVQALAKRLDLVEAELAGLKAEHPTA